MILYNQDFEIENKVILTTIGTIL